MENERTQQVAAGFNEVADEYDHPALRGFVLIADRLVERAKLLPGQQVLDVGTGTGNALLAAARAVGPEGHVTGVELAENMRAKALHKIAEAGIRHADVLAGDATALPFPDACFDIVLCASAIYTLPDIPAALEEWRRVLKPGGLLVFSSLAGDNTAFYSELLRKYGVPLPPELPLQRIDTPAKCTRFLQEAGFVEVAAHIESFGYTLPDVEQSWALIWNTGARIPLQYLPPPVVEQIKAEYLAVMAKSATDQGVWIDWQALFCQGRKREGESRRCE